MLCAGLGAGGRLLQESGTAPALGGPHNRGEGAKNMERLSRRPLSKTEGRTSLPRTPHCLWSVRLQSSVAPSSLSPSSLHPPSLPPSLPPFLPSFLPSFSFAGSLLSPVAVSSQSRVGRPRQTLGRPSSHPCPGGQWKCFCMPVVVHVVQGVQSPSPVGCCVDPRSTPNVSVVTSVSQSLPVMPGLSSLPPSL